MREELTQFQNQLDAVDRPTPRERIGSGNISPTITQAAGPQVAAKLEIKKQINATIAETAAELCWDSLPAVSPTIPTISCITIMLIAPYSKIDRRPKRSTM